MTDTPVAGSATPAVASATKSHHRYAAASQASLAAGFDELVDSLLHRVGVEVEMPRGAST